MKFTWENVAKWLWGTLMSVTLSAMGVIAWQGQEVLAKIDDHETRLLRIEETRFSKADGAILLEVINGVRQDVAVLQRSDTETARRLERIEDKLDVLLSRTGN